MKPFEERLERIRNTTDNDACHALTLDPSLRDHRIIALLINYTSRVGECPFYRIDVNERQCTIAPDFTIMWKNCEGRCFVGGITCPIISDHTSGTDESPYTRGLVK